MTKSEQRQQIAIASVALAAIVGLFIWRSQRHRHEELPQLPAPADVAAPPPGIARTASDITYAVLEPGTGARHPTASDRVSVHYTGWTTDGHMFDSSVARGEPAEFPLDHVIPGWTEGVQLMTEGEKVRFWIPGALAYDRPGQEQSPNVPHGTLVFDVQLLRIL